MFLNRLQIITKSKYPGQQYEYKAERFMNNVIFSLCQQEKCREKRQPHFIIFLDLTKVYIVEQTWPVQTSWQDRLLGTVQSFSSDMKRVIQFNSSSVENCFQYQYLSETRFCAYTHLFSNFSAIMLKHNFKTSTDGVNLPIRLDKRQLILSKLWKKAKVCKVFMRNILFADNIALAPESQKHLQHLIDNFSKACQDFSLDIDLENLVRPKC